MYFCRIVKKSNPNVYEQYKYIFKTERCNQNAFSVHADVCQHSSISAEAEASYHHSKHALRADSGRYLLGV